MTGHGDEADGDRVTKHEESVRAQLNRFDVVMVDAAAGGCDRRIVDQLGIMRDTAGRFNEPMLADAAAADHDGRGLDVLLAAVFRIPAYLDIALPEVLTERAVVNIVEALKRISSELEDYISDGQTAHLTEALGARFEDLHLALRDCYGWWQLGKGPWRSQRLDLRLGVPDGVGSPVAYPVLKILADGNPILNARNRSRYTEWPPGDILGPDAPLLPADPARRVALFVDATGGPAAGCLAAYVKAFGEQVAWADFRLFEGVYHAPTIQPNPDGGDWRMGIAPQVFDSAQYRAEV
jgi:hypothetical protein